MSDDTENEVIVGYIIQREDEEGDVTFWHPENEWQEDPNEGEFYEDAGEADATAKTLQEGDSATITVEVVYEDDEDPEEDEEDKA